MLKNNYVSLALKNERLNTFSGLNTLAKRGGYSIINTVGIDPTICANVIMILTTDECADVMLPLVLAVVDVAAVVCVLIVSPFAVLMRRGVVVMFTTVEFLRCTDSLLLNFIMRTATASTISPIATPIAGHGILFFLKHLRQSPVQCNIIA
jgi:hypothetical protein